LAKLQQVEPGTFFGVHGVEDTTAQLQQCMACNVSHQSVTAL